jgi:hypothetical protein
MRRGADPGPVAGGCKASKSASASSIAPRSLTRSPPHQFKNADSSRFSACASAVRKRTGAKQRRGSGLGLMRSLLALLYRRLSTHKREEHGAMLASRWFQVRRLCVRPRARRPTPTHCTRFIGHTYVTRMPNTLHRHSPQAGAHACDRTRAHTSAARCRSLTPVTHTQHVRHHARSVRAERGDGGVRLPDSSSPSPSPF